MTKSNSPKLTHRQYLITVYALLYGLKLEFPAGLLIPALPSLQQF